MGGNVYKEQNNCDPSFMSQGQNIGGQHYNLLFIHSWK